MDKRAQAGLEYLMTYGWALVLIATLVGAIVFIVGTPDETSFVSSDPTKLMVEGANTTGNQSEIILKNITGGKITIKKIDTVCSVSGCTLNGEIFQPSESLNIEVVPGGEIRLEGLHHTGSESIIIEYNDFADLSRTATVSSSSPEPEGGAQAPECSSTCDGICQGAGCFGTDPDCDASGGTTGDCCGNASCDAGECTSGCLADCDIRDCCGIEGCNAAFAEDCSSCVSDCSCAACFSCESGTCTPQTAEGAVATALGCTAGDEGCRRCDAGECTYYNSGQHGCGICTGCNVIGNCVQTATCLQEFGETFSDQGDWVFGTGWSISADEYLEFDGDVYESDAYLELPFGLEAGKTYKVVIDVYYFYRNDELVQIDVVLGGNYGQPIEQEGVLERFITVSSKSNNRLLLSADAEYMILKAEIDYISISECTGC